VPPGVTLTGEPNQAMPIVYSAAGAPDYAGVKFTGAARLADIDVRYNGGGFAVSGSGSFDRVIAEGGCFFGFTDTVVTNSVCAGDYGIYASVGGGGSWKVTLRNTTIVGGVEAMVLFSNGPQMTYELFNTIIHTNGSGTDISGGESGSGYVWLSANNSNYAMTSESGGAHVEPAGAGANQTAAPQFVDPGNGNYSELPSSPTVGGVPPIRSTAASTSPATRARSAAAPTSAPTSSSTRR